MKGAESALRTCSSETFAKTLTSPRSITHTEALAWLEATVSVLTAQMGSALPAAGSGTSGVMLRVSEADGIPRRTTGTGGDGDDDE
jgi:hypothetical protein